MKRLLVFIFVLSGLFAKGQVMIYDGVKSPRTQYGVARLQSVIKKYKLDKIKYSIFLLQQAPLFLVKPAVPYDTAKEGFTIDCSDQVARLTGNDENGILYAALELAAKIEKDKKFPDRWLMKDAPEMVLRGQCIGLQKPQYLPGRNVYEYPYTPETFPWFYDKELWIQVLDSMVNNRMNSLYLWNGHPFASLVRLKDYPYAVEVDDSTFKKNEEIYRFLTTEADKRGIWVIQMFIISSSQNPLQTAIKSRHRKEKDRLYH